MKRWSLEPQKRLNCSWLHLCLKESVLLSRSKRQLKCPRTASGSLSKERFSASGSPHQGYKHIQQLYHHKCPSCFRVRLDEKKYKTENKWKTQFLLQVQSSSIAVLQTAPKQLGYNQQGTPVGQQFIWNPCKHVLIPLVPCTVRHY